MRATNRRPLPDGRPRSRRRCRTGRGWRPDLYSAEDGSSIGKRPGPINFLIYWDGDESRELEDKTSITKYGASTLLSCDACASNNTTKATPTLTADLLGDWREEVVWRQADNQALRIYTTTAVTKRRI